MRQGLRLGLSIMVLLLGMFSAAATAQAESIMTKPLFHLTKVGGGEFYTTDPAEKDEMIRYHGYADLGVTCYVIGPEADPPPGMLPFFRLKFTGDYEGITFTEYLYTTSRSEVEEYISQKGWILEGIAGYVLDKDSSLSGTLPLYRWYCPCTYHWHGYSTDLDDIWITKLHQGTRYEGPACRVWDKECVYDYRDRHDKKGSRGNNAPADLRVKVLSYSRISLTWDKGDFPAVGYRVERRSNSGSWVTVANLGYRTQTFTDSGLDRYTRYYYRVRAYNLLGDSDYSEEISVCTSDHYDELDEYQGAGDPYSDQPLVIKLQVGSRLYYVNETPASMDTAPFINKGRTLVPIRFLAESIGAEVDWNDYQKKAAIFHKGELIELWVGRNTAQVNGERQPIDSSNAQLTPIIENGRIMLPLRFVTENLGFEVHWIDASQEIILTCFT